MITTTSKFSQPASTIIVSRPGIMQQSLRASLAACSRITVVASAGDGLTALSQVTKLQPGLLVIDANLLDDEVDALLMAVKSRQPATRLLVLVRSGLREGRLLACGADAVISRDGTVQELQETLSRLAQDGLDHRAKPMTSVETVN